MLFSLKPLLIIPSQPQVTYTFLGCLSKEPTLIQDVYSIYMYILIHIYYPYFKLY